MWARGKTLADSVQVTRLMSSDALSAPDRAALDACHVPLFDSLAWFKDYQAAVLPGDPSPTWLYLRLNSASLLLPLQRSRERISVTRALANYYMMRWQPLALLDGIVVNPAELPTPLWTAAARALTGLGSAITELSPLDPRADWIPRLKQALCNQRASVTQSEAFGNWVSCVNGSSFDAWFARRPGVVRNTWRRRRRQLEAQASITFELHGAGISPRPLEDAIAAYAHVYDRSWKESEPYPDFIPTLIRRAAMRGVLRLGLLLADNVPVAAQLWLRDSDAAVIYKLAYDEAWRSWSPGLALSVEMFRHAIDVDRVALIDYGSGDDAYKRDWMDERRVRTTLTAFHHRHPVGALLAVRHRLLSSGARASYG